MSALLTIAGALLLGSASVSGRTVTDQQAHVLAYADDANFDLNNMPPAFSAWLHEINTYGPAKLDGNSLPLQGGSRGSETSFLLNDIVWTQDRPMNNLCPRYYYDGYNYPTYAGCVAVAIGQIMRYYQYPTQGTGSFSYFTDSYSLPVSTDLDSHSYDWANILPNYIYTEPTAVQNDAVAQLVFDIAASVQMDFTPGASNTQDFRAAQALRRNFGYDASLQLIDHSNYTTAEWADVLRSEINAGRPVYVSGANIDARGQVHGHAFVVDGYNSDGYFHINWGWNGSSNGFYLLTDLTPKDKQGVGGSAAGYAFMQNAIIGIQPDCGGAESPAVLSLFYEQIWTVNDDKGTALHFQICNPSATDFSGLVALRITDKDGNALNNPMDIALKTQCKAGYGGERAWYIDLRGLGNRLGMRFEIIYQCDGEEEWHVAGARTGSPHSLVSYADAGGSIALAVDPDEVFQLRLADLKPLTALTPGSVAEFSATISNISDYEYFAPLYLMVYDADGALQGYTDYQLCLVPAHSEAQVSFSYQLPTDKGQYNFCVAYETLGYNYDYSPMLRSDNTTYAFLLGVGEESLDDPVEDPNPNPEPGTDTPTDGQELLYVLECVDYGFDAVRRDVKVRFEGQEVYIQGISGEVPEGWVHATISGTTAIFETPLLLGEWNYYGSIRKQYITGADTNTGDVSGLAMAYDPLTRSFTGYSNNWILLTGTPGEVGFYYDHLYNSVTILPQSQASEDPTITPPSDLKTSTYQLRGRNPLSHLPIDYLVNVGFSGSDVYAQGLYPAFPKAWAKGTVSGNSIEFKTPQFVGNYHGLYNMYVAGLNPLTEELQTLTMAFDATTRALSSLADCWFVVQAGEEELMPMMMLSDVTIAPYQSQPLSFADLQLPLSLQGEVLDATFQAVGAEDKQTVYGSLEAVLSGNDVYLRGLSSYFPEAWVHGTIDQYGIAIFPRNQHMGNMQGYDIWLGAGDVTSGEMLYGDFLLLYDSESRTFTQPQSNYLAINASTTDVYHLELYQNVVITLPGNSTAIESLDSSHSTSELARVERSVTTTNSHSPFFDLFGRRTTSPHGFLLRGNTKVLLK